MGRKVRKNVKKIRGPGPDLKKRWSDGFGRAGEIVPVFIYISFLGI